MVRLDRIYTRSGDKGQTSLGDGTRVPKTSARIAAGGVVDELNGMIGLGAALCESQETRSLLQQLQQQLFDLGADLTYPLPERCPAEQRSRMTAAHTGWLETQIDTFTARLAPLTSFVLPGGTTTAACLHLARAVCRRAELVVLRLQESEQTSVNPNVAVYLNRLSDLLFVLARSENDDGRHDVLWEPGSATPSDDNADSTCP